jgi:hypothetical protein
MGDRSVDLVGYAMARRLLSRTALPTINPEVADPKRRSRRSEREQRSAAPHFLQAKDEVLDKCPLGPDLSGGSFGSNLLLSRQSTSIP